MTRSLFGALFALGLLTVSPVGKCDPSSGDTYSIDVVSDSEQTIDSVASFNEGLKGLSSTARVNKCDLVLVHMIGGTLRNRVYGAVCRLTTDRDVLLCADPVFGGFALSTNFTESQRTTLDFMRRNCPGG